MIVKPTSTTNVVEGWLLEQTTGAAIAQIVTPTDDAALTNATWGSDSNGKYMLPGATTGRAVGTIPLTGSGPVTFRCCFLDDGSMPAIYTFPFLLFDTNSSNNNICYLVRNGTFFGPGVQGKYSFVVANNSVTSFKATGGDFITGLVDLVGTYDDGTGLVTLYVNGVQTAQVTLTGTRLAASGANLTAVIGNYATPSSLYASEFPIYFSQVLGVALTSGQALAAYNALTPTSSSSSSSSSSATPSSSSGSSSDCPAPSAPGAALFTSFTPTEIHGIVETPLPAGATSITIKRQDVSHSPIVVEVIASNLDAGDPWLDDTFVPGESYIYTEYAVNACGETQGPDSPTVTAPGGSGGGQNVYSLF